MNKQKRITISACALFIMLGFVVSGVTRLRDAEEEEKAQEQAEAFLDEADSAKEEDDEYTLKIQDGVVVVFSEADNLRPIIVTDIYAGTLRNLDREKLTSGISVNGELELQKILEDYSS